MGDLKQGGGSEENNQSKTTNRKQKIVKTQGSLVVDQSTDYRRKDLKRQGTCIDSLSEVLYPSKEEA